MEDWSYEGYKNAVANVRAYERMFELEIENERLKEEVKKHEDRINGMFRADMKSIGETLSVLLK